MKRMSFTNYSGRYIKRRRKADVSGRKTALRIVSLLLCLCMVIPMLCNLGGLVQTSAAQATQYVTERKADPDTMDDYQNRLLNDANGSRYAGRVWTDKSVFAYADGSGSISLDMETDGYVGNVSYNADFGHAFSALASSQVVSESSPMDVMFVLDVSGSMGHVLDENGDKVPVTQDNFKDAPVSQLVVAVNDVIKELLTASPNSRFGIAVYGSTAAILVPLGHYTRSADADFLKAEYLEPYGTTQGLHYLLTATVQDANDPTNVQVYYADNAGQTSNDTHGKDGTGNRRITGTSGQTTGTGTASKDSDDKSEGPFHVGHITNPQAGFAVAMNELIEDNTELTWETSDGRKLQRIPAMIHLTDGQASDLAWIQTEGDSDSQYKWMRTTNNWNNVDWNFDLAYNSPTGSAESAANYYNASQLTGTGDVAPVIFQTLMTVAYYKSAVEAYYASSGATDSDGNVVSMSAFSVYVSDTTNYDALEDMQIKATIDAILAPATYFHDDADPNKTSFDSSGLSPTENTTSEFIDTAYELFKKWKDDGSVTTTFNRMTTSASDKANLENDINNITININATRDGIGTSEFGAYGDRPWSKDITLATIEKNINYVSEEHFFTAGFSELNEVFTSILQELLGDVFNPLSGDNDAGIGDSITYQDPLGEYMEIKNNSITTTPLHLDEPEMANATYDMALLLFGEMHGLVRAGVYDWQWNERYMIAHPDAGAHGEAPFPQGWYRGDGGKDTTEIGGDGEVPNPAVAGKEYASATAARADGWVFRLNYKTAIQYVSTLRSLSEDADLPPSDLPDAMKSTVYTVYRFSCNDTEGDVLRRNPIYGDVPQTLRDGWEKQKVDGKYPDNSDYYSGTPGVYRLNDIRVWIEDTGDYVDDTGNITPNGGYDRSLYLNVPVSAVPTQLATITLGNNSEPIYETNLATDKGLLETDDDFKKFSYQSTPLRLFYAVGLEDSLILRDEDGNQTGVDFSKISPEYIAAHTVEGQNYVWFLSNYFSNTTYDDYVTDTAESRTRGDPTVTFAPSIDNRYYVFQKPLPLYAHAYRANGDTLTPVDRNDGVLWTAADNRVGGNGKQQWEGGATGGTWSGGEFMGTYNSQSSFQEAQKKLRTEDGVSYITDDHGASYVYADGGIVLLSGDALNRVTNEVDSDNYTEDSVSFSSDDYFFILVEYYLPTGGTGVDQDGNEVQYSSTARKVQYVLARKGSEFGSGFVSDKISNGDMLCWTDMNGLILSELEYRSKTDSGDRTRGEPTWEKLTLKENALREYLEGCGIEDVEAEYNYWTGIQANTQVQTALDSADANDDGILEEDEFNKAFQFAVATRRGGIRTGDMANNIQSKSENRTQTSNSYYLPTVSENSDTGDDLIINNYLGNNGYLEIANQMLHVTKLLEAPEGFTLTDGQLDQEFNYQIYVQGVSGTRNAIRTEYNVYAQTWERELAYIDVLTDNSELVLDNNSNRALFIKTTVEGTEGATTTAKQVIAHNDSYYEANEDGTLTFLEDGSVNTTVNQPVAPGAALYYLYLPSNGESADTQHTRRLYQNQTYDGTADGYSGTYRDNQAGYESDFGRNGTTTFFAAGQRQPTGTEGGQTDRDSFRETNDFEKRPAGTITYWAQDAELIPIKEVMAAEGADEIVSGGGSSYGLEAESVGMWTHDHCDASHQKLQFFTFVIRRPYGETSDTAFESPFMTRSQYMTVTLEFGKNANPGDGGEVGTAINPSTDLYDPVIPSADRPDLFSDKDLSQIAANTAEFTLRHGEGLLLSGLDNRIAYRFTEKLTAEQLAAGYALKEISHIQQVGSESIYRPGVQEIPVYTQENATYGAEYPGAEAIKTENELTWALEKNGTEHSGATKNLEPFAHTNAVMWEYYATMTEGDAGNHHQPDGAGPEVEGDVQAWTGAHNEYAGTGERHEVADNPSCTDFDPTDLANSGCDLRQDDGTILHYMYYQGVLLDPHYNGEASTYLRNMARYGVSPTVRFGVEGEDAVQPYLPAAVPTDGNYNYNGIYSVYGNTGWFEEQAHYTNTVSPDMLVLTKQVVDETGAKVEPAPAQDFEFQLTLSDLEKAAIQDADGTLYYWQGLIADLGKSPEEGGPPALDQYLDYTKAPEGEETYLKPISISPSIEVYRFFLKSDEAVVIYGLGAGTTYTVNEVKNNKYPAVDGGTHLDTGDAYYTQTGEIQHNITDHLTFAPAHSPNRADFYNRMSVGLLTVEKKVLGDSPDTETAFGFSVTLSGKDLKKGELTATKYEAGSTEGKSLPSEMWGESAGADGVTVLTATFNLKHGEKVTIEGLPPDTKYLVKETQRNGYNLQHVADNAADEPEYLPVSDDSVDGTLSLDELQAYLLFVNDRASFPPFTGGPGWTPLYLLGLLLLILPAAAVLFRRRRRSSM